MTNPLLYPLRNFYIYLLLWSGVITLHAYIIIAIYKAPFLLAFADSMFYNGTFAILAIGLWYPVRFLKIDSNRFFTVLLNHIAVGSLLSVICLSFNFVLLQFLFSSIKELNVELVQFMPFRFITGLFYYFILVLFNYLYIYYISFKENLIKSAELNGIVKETQLELLKLQMNPHFIFNSLNSISSLTISNPEKAQDMVIKLSAFLRYSIGQKGNAMVQLQKEMENCLLYLDIEKVRFGNRLHFEQVIEDNTKALYVPEMLLQPLLENAVKHGVYESLEAVNILLTCSSTDTMLHISIKNTMDPQALKKPGKGIGIRNVIERLDLIYGKGDWLRTEKRESEFLVFIDLPIISN